MLYHYNLAQLFSSVCIANKKNLGIKYQDNSYTYQQIDSDSNIMASALLSQGLKRGDVIAIFNSKEYPSYILMLACLKIGVIYTNIDPDSPPERFKYILEICVPVHIFTDHQCAQQLNEICLACGFEIKNINTLMDARPINYKLLDAVSQGLDGDAIAYIMFTSGSTGKPKGVAITHQNVLHFINWTISYYQINSNDVLANVNPMYFDNSVFDFYTSLFSGACLAPLSKSIVSSAKLLVDHIDRLGCTLWFSVPSMLIYLMTMRVLNKKSFSNVRIITFGGEGFPKIELKKLYDLYSDRVKFVNVYGPTECTCICSSYELTDKDFVNLQGLPPLGYINPNFSFMIMDNNGSVSEGELCLFGPNVGRGYYNNLEVTNKSFNEYTGSGYYQSRMYRTGDIVTIRDGLLYFIGRKDNQIKHMGYRIELEEIELAINLIPEVTEVAVLYQKNTSMYGKILAYVASSHSIDSKYIRNEIGRILPSYMIPNTIIIVDQLLKNSNGKIDKRVLLNQINETNNELTTETIS